MKIEVKNSSARAEVTFDRAGALQRFISARRTGADELSIFNPFPPAAENVVAQMVFGGCQYEAGARQRMNGADWPMLWLQGDVCPGTQISGLCAFTLSGGPIQRIKLGQQVVGSAWSDAAADYCLLAGVLPSDHSAAGGAQTGSCFENIEGALQQAGMDFSHVVRTWFYLDHLLDWYDEFNTARTRFFRSRGVFDRLVPASTGIGAKNPAGAGVVAGVLAVKPKNDRVTIKEIASPLQCPATDYRSSFSRAVELGLPDHRLLMISGTAGIAPNGETKFADSTVKQIHLTLDVVEAILKSRGMGWQDTTRAVGYFRDLQSLAILEGCCRERGIAPLPLAPAHATVCRDDLWFEIELDAAVANPAADNLAAGAGTKALPARNQPDGLLAVR